MGGTRSSGPHRRRWLGESSDVTQGPSKWAGEWLRWAGCGRRAVTLIEAPPTSLERRDPLLKLRPIRGKAPGWHGNYSTHTLPQSVGGDGKVSRLSFPHFLARPLVELEGPPGNSDCPRIFPAAAPRP